ncbi:hypothetical protein [Actinoplanes solisilvae]|uniref:hypothetical protein n=1 Tax=Actinoplanes solisilvae TaxID=2486853 RepID=UPI000FDCA3E7|nr:hypothetical protein [Actinoplanes solisilvae]
MTFLTETWLVMAGVIKNMKKSRKLHDNCHCIHPPHPGTLDPQAMKALRILFQSFPGAHSWPDEETRARGGTDAVTERGAS